MGDSNSLTHEDSRPTPDSQRPKEIESQTTEPYTYQGLSQPANRPSLNEKPSYDEKNSGLEDTEALIKYLRWIIKDNENDPNFPSALLHKAAEALEPGVPPETVAEIVAAIRAEVKLGEENSPYPEVRACVSAVDDPATPVMTFRMWTIGLMLVVLGSGLNQFFVPRLPGISLSVTFAQLIAYPIGCFMARFLPTRVFHIGKRSFTFNPGPFNMKEHMLISIMANASFGGAYATDVIAVLRIERFYNNPALGGNLGFQAALVLSTQLIGYTLAGLTRRFLVYPRAMVWWGKLLEISVLRALHSKDEQRPVHGWKISQMRFFTICAVVYGIYFILPDVFFQSLSYFNWTTWIAPENAKLAIITGTVTGLGLNPLPTLDWNFMSTDPIVVPMWSIMNGYVGALGGMMAICGMYFRNALFTAYLPINSNGVFDRMGKRYNASRVLNKHGVLDQAQYEAYSPPFMAAANVVLYTGFMALYTSTLVYAGLHYRKHIFGGFSSLWNTSFLARKFRRSDRTEKNSTGEQNSIYADVHYRLMQSYPEVPEWWFLIIGVVSVTLAIFTIEYYQTQMPVWGLAFALGIALLLIVPCGIMDAVASVSAPLNVLSELVGGYALPGRPLANMMFKTFGYITMAQALGYAADMKLAHYVKIPPRATFIAQTVATILSALVSMAVLNWQLEQFPDLCSPTQPLHFTCPLYNTFFTASIIWGAVGPHRLFTRPGALYQVCIYGFLIGAIVPFIPWLAAKKWPRSGWSMIHTPIIISGFLAFAPENLAYYTPTVPLALFFQGYVKRRFTAWYEKYALTLTAGISAGIAIFGLVYFFAFQMNGQSWDWAGNTIYEAGCDGQACPLKEVPKEGFGPTSWA
ncbi:hypothetical protein CROQUDRAFT_652218 [Cronartium quercuum f. sp. fusiforme G11]|uniref:Oligopeptide transporter n=1 Tax=Cronartium quercuum f. sp. fusiforme G11 TaxID=708437 RepID=A0A9P6NUN8_9BASI|nr:hypothetical protein CROQUDRAFT_652218 [Cronartium quercuum f. sp. fusiforme G11]